MKNERKCFIETLEDRTVMDGGGGVVALFGPPPIYSYDGTGNNLQHAQWGSTDEDLLRTALAEYGDGISTPAGTSRPSARLISNTVAAQSDDIISDRLMSAMIYAWGQFIDHDIGLTKTGTTESFNISVPTGDPSFDPNSTGTQTIALKRSVYDAATGTTNARQQINSLTSWLDASMIYGVDAATATKLRTLVGGRMKTSAGNLLPLNNAATFPTGTLPMANDAHRVADSELFAAGDVRANENVELTSLHTLFVREHNYWAGQIQAANPNLSDEQIFQQARSRVIGEIQSITFNEWLPAVLGTGAVHPYSGYKPNVNPGLANEFSTAAFRFGHSLLGDDVEFLGNNGDEVGEEVSLAESFFNPDLVKQFNIAPILKYLASDPSSELDTQVVDSVRNFLFGPPGAGGLDLASLNIQRGRDHGLADYNDVRQAYGLPRARNFADITHNTDVQAKLQSLYGNVNNIDLWVGALAEDHVPGASVGPTLRAVISQQFERIRDGDRLWYQNQPPSPLLQQLNSTTLASVIARNTATTNLQQNAFFFKSGIAGVAFADLNRDGRQQRNEMPLANRPVELLDAETNEVVDTAMTDSHGVYHFGVADGIRTGDYRVRLAPPPGGNPNTPSSRVVSITRGDQFINDANIAAPPPPGGGMGPMANRLASSSAGGNATTGAGGANTGSMSGATTGTKESAAISDAAEIRPSTSPSRFHLHSLPLQTELETSTDAGKRTTADIASIRRSAEIRRHALDAALQQDFDAS